jgi:uncharacterized protein (TIGR02466 family)
MEIAVKQLFAYPVAIFNLEDTFDDFFKKERLNQTWAKNGSDHCVNNYSSNSMSVLDGYENEKNTLMECVNLYKNEIMKWHKSELKITTSWLTKTEQGGFSKSHFHYNSLISGVLYDAANGFNGVGNIVFSSPKQASILPCEPSTYTLDNCTEFYVSALPNHLILFESSLRHHIGKHESVQPRISLAFNTFPIGQVGLNDSSFKVKI